MSPRSARWAVLVVTAVGGAGTMVVELAAVRLLAPWFGTSQAVWTNVIAVVLAALAAGYLLGGRLSARGRPLRWLAIALLAAGFLTAWLPELAGRVAPLYLPPDVALHEAAELVSWGSLATSMLLFLPPAAILGLVAPLAVEAVQELAGGAAGRAGGAVLCASTLGSLAGVFGTSHVLLPGLGLTGTFLAASSALVAAGLLGLLLARSKGHPGDRTGGVAIGLLLGWSAALGTSRAVRPAPQEGSHELAYAETPYQSVRVVEREAEGGEALRLLQVNEAFDSYQSVWQPEPGLLPEGYYYNDFALPFAWEWQEAGTAPEDWQLLVLGLGGGTAVRVLEGTLPEGTRLDATGIELDPGVVGLARAHLDLEVRPPGAGGARRVFAGLDARVALGAQEDPFDQIVLDCYANQVEIPPHLCTLEFFGAVHARLRDGGWLTANLAGFGFDDPVVASVASTCAAAFEAEVLLLRVPFSRNVTLVARRGHGLPVEVGGAGREAFVVPTQAVGEAGELVSARRLPGGAALVGPGEGTLLTDDHCPMERLQRRSIEEGPDRLRGSSLAPVGDEGRGAG